MNEKERMVSGQLYSAQDETLRQEHASALRLTRLYNRTTEEESGRRAELLRELFATIGNRAVIEPTFRCDYGRNIHIGDNFFANFDCIILDVCPVTIGSDVLFGPRSASIRRRTRWMQTCGAQGSNTASPSISGMPYG